MSAFIVDKNTITVLVAAGLQVGSDHSVPDDLASDVGQRLLDECIASVQYRYSDCDFDDLPGSYETADPGIPGIVPLEIPQWLTPYAFAAPESKLTRAEIEDEIGCYEYQSCEHPEWEDSWAQRYCIALRAAIRNMVDEPEPQEPEMSPEEFRARYGDLSRDETIKRIRDALKRRSGKAWSVTGGRGTAWGWIHIQSPPKRRTGKHVQREGAEFGMYDHVDTGVAQEFGIMTPQDCAELALLLGKDRVHHQGEGIPSGSDYYREYIDRAEGREPAAYGVQYWD